jgi:hypothetical protein
MRYEKRSSLLIVTLEFDRFFSNLVSIITGLWSLLPQPLTKKNFNRGVLGQIFRLIHLPEIKLIFQDLIS